MILYLYPNARMRADKEREREAWKKLAEEARKKPKKLKKRLDK